MGCSTSTPAAAPVAPVASEPEVSSEPEKPAEESIPEKTSAPDTASPAVDDSSAPKKTRRASARTRVLEMCDEGWLEAAEAYCRCMERGEEWGSNEADAVLKEKAGEGFDEARATFENFDVDGDRHVQLDELASALEVMGQ